MTEATADAKGRDRVPRAGRRLLAFRRAGGRAFAITGLIAIVGIGLALQVARGGTRSSVIWLWPYAYGLATLGTLAIATRLREPERRALFRRHFALYLVLPATVAFVTLDPVGRAARWGAGYVALALAFGALGAVTLWRSRATLDDATMARRLGTVVLTSLLVIVPYHALAIPPEADEPHYLVITQSLAYDRDLDLRNDYHRSRYSAFYPGRLPDVHAIEVGPALYPIRDVGLPLVAAIPFALAGRAGVLVLLACLAALLAVQLYRLLRDLRFAPGVAIVAVAIASFTHPLLTWSTQIYPDLLAALVVVTVARLLGPADPAGPRRLALAGALAGTLPWLTTRADFVALGLALAIAWRIARGSRGTRAATVARRVGAAAAGVVLPLALLAALDWTLFGLPIPGAGFYLIRGQQDVVGAPQVGALGLLFDRVFGLVGVAPIYLVALLGVRSLVTRALARPTAIGPLAIAGATHLVFVASLQHWHSDWAPASRNLVIVLPLLVVALAGGIETLGRARRWRPSLGVAAATLLGWSAFAALVFAANPQIRYNLPAHLRRTGATGRFWLFVQDNLGGIDVGRALPSLVQESASVLPLSLAWLGLSLAMVVLGWRLAPRPA